MKFCLAGGDALLLLQRTIGGRATYSRPRDRLLCILVIGMVLPNPRIISYHHFSSSSRFDGILPAIPLTSDTAIATPADLPAPAPLSSLAPFYDPSADCHNEDWALQQRQGRKSDAVLSCPACLTTLCIDCQRHELYVNQYRAMFVRNCTIVETERLRYSDNRKRKRNARHNRRLHEQDITGGGPGMIRIDPKSAGVDEETFKPVRCTECGAQVAVLDSDEVYHFFDIIPTFS